MIMIKHNKKKEIHTHVLHPKQSKNQCITVTISKTKTVLHDITLDYVTVSSIYLHLKLNQLLLVCEKISQGLR